MKRYTVTDNENLRTLCIKHNWFTCGDCEQYQKLFYANEHGCPVEEIATIIWLCSDEKWCRRDILSILEEEQATYQSKNQKMRTLTLTRRESNDIRRALTAVMCSFAPCESSYKYWETLREKVIAQLESQDPVEE